MPYYDRKPVYNPYKGSKPPFKKWLTGRRKVMALGRPVRVNNRYVYKKTYSQKRYGTDEY